MSRSALRCRLVHLSLEPAPPEWDRFVAREQLLPFWRAELLTLAARHTSAPTFCALVTRGEVVVALAHLRGLLPTRMPRRHHRARLCPALVAQGVPVSMGSGIAFARELSADERGVAVRVLRRELRRRLATVVVLYRDVSEAERAVLPGRPLRRLSDHHVLEVRWPDYDTYLRSLTRRKWRQTLRTVRRRHTDLDVEITAGPLPDEAEALVRVVAQAHAGALGTAVPPEGYLALLGAQPEALHLTYRDPSGRLVAYCLGLRCGERLVAVSWGRLPDDEDGPRDLYFDMFARWVELALAGGCTRVELGKGMPEVKAKYEATAQPRWLVGSW